MRQPTIPASILVGLLCTASTAAWATNIERMPLPDALRQIASDERLATNPSLIACKTLPPGGEPRAAKMLDIGNMLVKLDEIEIAEPFFRESWLTAEKALGSANPKVEPYAARYAKYLEVDTAGLREYGQLRSAESEYKTARDAKTRERALKEARKHRELIQNQRKDAENGLDVWYKIATDAKNAITYYPDLEKSELLSTLVLGHSRRVDQNDNAERVELYLNLAEAYQKDKKPADALRAYKDAVKEALLAYRFDSDECVAVIDKLYNSYPSEVASTAELIKSAKEKRAPGAISLRPGESKPISPHAFVFCDTSGNLQIVLNEKNQQHHTDEQGIPLTKSALIYDEGKMYKISYRGKKTKTVVTCCPEHHPQRADYDVDVTPGSEPAIVNRTFTKDLNDGSLNFWIDSKHAYNVAPGVILVFQNYTLGSALNNTKAKIITPFGTAQIAYPQKVGELTSSSSGTLQMKLERLPAPSKIGNAFFKFTVQPSKSGVASGARLVQINY